MSDANTDLQTRVETLEQTAKVLERTINAQGSTLNRYKKIADFADEMKATKYLKASEKRLRELASRLQLELLKAETVTEVYRYAVSLAESTDPAAHAAARALDLPSLPAKLFAALEQPDEFWGTPELTIHAWASKIAKLQLSQ